MPHTRKKEMPQTSARHIRDKLQNPRKKVRRTKFDAGHYQNIFHPRRIRKRKKKSEIFIFLCILIIGINFHDNISKRFKLVNYLTNKIVPKVFTRFRINYLCRIITITSYPILSYHSSRYLVTSIPPPLKKIIRFLSVSFSYHLFLRKCYHRNFFHFHFLLSTLKLDRYNPI